MSSGEGPIANLIVTKPKAPAKPKGGKLNKQDQIKPDEENESLSENQTLSPKYPSEEEMIKYLASKIGFSLITILLIRALSNFKRN